MLLLEWEVLTRVKEGNILRYPNVQAYARKEPIEEILQELKCTALSVNHTILNAKRIMQIKEELRIPLLFAWTVNKSERAFELYCLGVDSVISDNPVLILQEYVDKISAEFEQFKIPPKTIDIVINYLGIFNNNAKQAQSIEPKSFLQSVEKNSRPFNHG